MTPVAQQLWKNRAAEANRSVGPNFASPPQQSPKPAKPRKMVRFNATLTLLSPKVAATMMRPRMNSTYGGTSSNAGATPFLLRRIGRGKQRVGKALGNVEALPDKRPPWKF